MSRRRLNSIFNMAVDSNTSLTNLQVTTSDLPLLTMEDIILNSEVVFEFPEEGTNFDHNLSIPTIESSSVITSASLSNLSKNGVDNKELLNNTSTNLLYINSEVIINETKDSTCRMKIMK